MLNSGRSRRRENIGEEQFPRERKFRDHDHFSCQANDWKCEKRQRESERGGTAKEAAGGGALDYLHPGNNS